MTAPALSDAAFRAWVASEVHSISGILPESKDEVEEPETPEEIPRHRAYVSGVYRLYLAGELQYVGQSGNIFSRIAQHMSIAPFEFDEFEITTCAPQDRLALEAKLIRELEPRWNRDYPAHLDYKYRVVGPHSDKQNFGLGLPAASKRRGKST